MSALDEAGVTIPNQVIALPDFEVAQHVWVQYASGTKWIDLDPAFPDAVAGQIYATSPQILSAIPVEWAHTITFSIVAEKIQGGSIATSRSPTPRTQNLVGKSATLVHLQPSALQGLGTSITGALEGTTQYIPHLAFGPNDVVPGSDRVTLMTGKGPDDVFGGSGNDGDTLSESLVITLTSPASRIGRSVRTVFDRLGAERRD